MIRTRLALALLMVLVTAPTALADSEQPWEFDGGGWGHGLGLSQFGALGQAEDGRDASQILEYYYTGTAMAEMPADHWSATENGLLVGLVSNAESVDLSAVGGPVTVCQPAPGCEHVAQVINPGEDWKFEVDAEDPTRCRLRQVGVANTGYAMCSAEIGDMSPTNRLQLNGREYARGVIQLDPALSGFHAVAALDMESYLYGLAEVPSSWPVEALKAQAIIGRSYALATAADRGGDDGATTLSSCGCHLFSTTADQVYVGWSKENPVQGNFGAEWKAAVDATTGEILIHPESNYAFDVARAFYSSSNGGASENNEDVWGGTPLPWIRSVADPWSADPEVNPLARWTILVEDSDMAAYFGWDRALDAFVLTGPPGVLVEFTGKDSGEDVSEVLNGTEIRSLLNSIGYRSDGAAVRTSPYILSVVDPPGFDDIVGHLFEADIDWILGEEITKGCNPPANTRYCPDEGVSRGQMAAFLARGLDLAPTSIDFFDDDDGTTFESDINRLAAAGVTKGCGQRIFCPDDDVTRGQMAAFLVRALGLSDAGAGDLFVDDDDSIFRKDIDVIGTAGITKGCNPPVNDRFCPEDSVDRGQMAAFLHRALDS